MSGFAAFGQPEMKIVELSGDAENLRVNITARKDGIIAAILEMMGISGTASIQGDVEGCTFERSSFTGQSRTYIAWSQVSATVYTIGKAVAYLATAMPLVVLAISSFIGGSKSGIPPALGVLFLGLAAVLIVFFFLKRSVVVGLLTSGGTVEGIKLKGSAEQMEQLKAVMKVMEMLNRAASDTDAGNGHRTPAAAPSHVAPPAFTGGADATVATCPHCQARMKVPNGKAGHAMRCPKCSQTFTL